MSVNCPRLRSTLANMNPKGIDGASTSGGTRGLVQYIAQVRLLQDRVEVDTCMLLPLDVMLGAHRSFAVRDGRSVQCFMRFPLV